MILQLLIVLLFTQPIFSCEDFLTSTGPIHKLHSDFQHLHLELKHWGATTSQIKKAPCRSKIPSKAEIDSFIKKHESSLNKKSSKINHIQFENESPEMLQLSDDFTTKVDNIGYKKADTEQTDYSRNYSIPSNCKKVRCALQSILSKHNISKDQTDKMIYFKLKHGMNTSHLPFEDVAIIHEKELDLFILGTEDLPRDLLPIDKNKKMVKFKRGYGNGSTIANATITFFDAWNDLESDEKRIYTVQHELAHYLGYELNLDETPEWLNISGWTKKSDDKWEFSCSNCFASLYGKTNPAEDFAESVSTYRYNPSLLKDVSPSKYKYIKDNIFFGKEFTHESKCKESYGVISKAYQGPIHYSPTQEEVDSAKKTCFERFFSEYFNNSFSFKNKFESCLNENFIIFSLVDKSNLTPKEIEFQYQRLLQSKIGAKALAIQNKSSVVPDTQFTKITEDFNIALSNDVAELYKSVRKDRNVYHMDFFPMKENTDIDFCERWSKYAYQKVENTKLSDRLLKTTAYHHKDAINKHMNSLCIEIWHQSKGDRTKFPEELPPEKFYNMYK